MANKKLPSQWNPRTKRYNRTPRVLAAIKAMEDSVGPDGRERASANDCVPSAISFSTGIPFWKVVEALYDANRILNHHGAHRRGTGWYPSEYAHAMAALGVTYVKERRSVRSARRSGLGGYPANGYGYRVLSHSVNTSPTLARTLDGEAREGRWLVQKRRHLIGVVDGVPHHCTYRSYSEKKDRRARVNDVYFLMLDN